MKLLLSLGLAAAALAAPVFDVTSHGARGDGRTRDTAAIQSAIEACHQAGGGLVYFPPGRFLSGTLVLKSNVTLHLSPGATLVGSPRIADYNPRHLIYARRANNIAIEGGGSIDGNGGAFWISGHVRPEHRPSPLIELVECAGVRIQNVRILDFPGWCLHPLLCDRVTIREVTIIAPMFWLNTDGIDPDSSRNVHISNCYIRAGDDCIVLKTTGRAGLPAPACENVTVTNCVLVSSASALKLGTESHGDFRNVHFSNCVIRGSRTGIALLAKDGGVMEAIRFSNIVMETHPKHGRGVEWPIVVDLEQRSARSRLGRIRDVSFSDIQIRTRGRMLVSGMPSSPLEQISFHNLAMRIEGFEEIEGASKLRGGTVEKVPGVVDLGPAPAALIFGHVTDLSLRGIRVLWPAAASAAPRHALYATHVDGLQIEDFIGRPAGAETPLAALGLDRSRRIFVTRSRAAPPTSIWIGLRGTSPDQVTLLDNDVRSAGRVLAEGSTYAHLP